MKKLIFCCSLILITVFLFAQIEANVVIYEEGFEGSTTASGELFSQDKLTAAHGTLALGTQVEIMNIHSGKKVIVTINDKLNDFDGLFWVTKAAAKEIDLETKMPMKVLYNVVAEPANSGPTEVYQTLFASLSENLEYPAGNPLTPLVTEDKEAQAYGVQVYSTAKRMDAVTLSRRIQQEIEYISYFEKYKSEDGSRYRVIIGDFHTMDEAKDCYMKLRYDIPHIFLVEIY